MIIAVVALILSSQSSSDQYRLTARGQITDRFSKAVDQLGSDKIELRIGGVYALERIKRDSPDDAGAINEVLCAFVDNRTEFDPRGVPTYPALRS